MEVVKYRTELDENRHNVLVMEESAQYGTAPLITEKFNSPDVIYEMMCRCFRLDKMAEEYVYMIGLDCKEHMLGVFEISHGTVNVSAVCPREVFIRALLCGAVGIVLVHNHPSGECDPSRMDAEITKRIKESGEMIGIKLLDHIIMGEGYFSFQENRMIINN
ncbi:MAG: JAB domain-containing protein [Lachnospiraceae bacterium]|nr:JAB domain-containing protein [Lachnospiraceae bacterium]